MGLGDGQRVLGLCLWGRDLRGLGVSAWGLLTMKSNGDFVEVPIFKGLPRGFLCFWVRGDFRSTCLYPYIENPSDPSISHTSIFPNPQP